MERGRDLQPDFLRERIAELRVQIEAVASQKRQEQQREREENLQRLRDDIMRESRRDGRTMRGIAYVTMAFLPATFVSTFFGMNFFDSGNVFDEAGRNVWVFFIIALPVSAVVLLVVLWWERKQEGQEAARVRKGLP